MREYQQERAIYEVTELLESVMEEQGITRAELAKRLGQSKSWVTQLLDGEQNKTIRTVADVFALLGREYCSFQRPIQIGRGSSSLSGVTEIVGGESGGLKLHYGDWPFTTGATSEPARVDVTPPLRAVK